MAAEEEGIIPVNISILTLMEVTVITMIENPQIYTHIHSEEGRGFEKIRVAS